MYQQVEDTLDPGKRKELAYDLQRKLLAEYLFSPLAYSPGVYGTQKHVSGYVAPAFGISSAFRLERVWVE